MIFQTLDDKPDCPCYYVGGEAMMTLVGNNFKTWSWNPNIPSGAEVAQIWTGGKSLEEVCPENLKDNFKTIDNKLKALYRSFNIAKIDLNETCFYDLVNEGDIKEYATLKDKITESVFQNYSRPINYGFMVSLYASLAEIERNYVNIDWEWLATKRFTQKGKAVWDKLQNSNKKIAFSPYGSKTGRLTLKDNAIPILNLDKEYRKAFKPNNDWFVEFDYNAADLRSFFYVLDKPQPKGDLHDWNTTVVYKNAIDRDQAKKAMFAWLYDLNKEDQQLEKYYERNKILDTFYKEGKIVNPFGREIECDKDHAIPYLVQSTTADYVLRKLNEVNVLLKGKNTKIFTTIHDSIVIDLDWSERAIINDILAVLRKDNFVVNTSTGKNFGEMREIKL